jgi:hypothetical protein
MCAGRPPFFKENANNFYQVGARARKFEAADVVLLRC